ncbi:MAG TPA: ABC transporter permease [Bacillota bacterium]
MTARRHGPGPGGAHRYLGPALARAAWAGAAFTFVLLLGLPVLAILLRSLASGEFLAALGSPVVVQALRLTAATSLAATGLAALLGTPVAYLLARCPFRGRTLLENVIELPIILPPSVAGLGLLMAFGRRGLVGEPLASMGLTVSFTTAAVILAQFFVAAPLFVRAARAGFAAVDRELETVAHTLGVSSGRTFWRVTVPIAFPSLLSGLVMCWARAIGEFGATILFAGSFPGRTQTMSLAIYAALEHDLEAALAIAAVLVILSFGVLLLLRLAVVRWGEWGA